MVLNLSEAEFLQMKGALLDADGQEALRLLKLFINRIEQQKRSGMKSHLDG